MNTQLQNQISDGSLKATKRSIYKLSKSLLLFFVSSSLLITLVYVRPYSRILQAWNAAMRNDSVLVHAVATKLLRHPRIVYQHWGLYYDVLSKVMSGNMSTHDMSVLRSTLIKEYFYKGQTIDNEDIAHLVPRHAHESELKTMDKYMYMLLGYLDFSRMDYQSAVDVYWEILQRYETDDVIRYNYEVSLFFLNYTEINKKESNFSTVGETENKKNKILPIPSLMKIRTGISYYMREKEKSYSTLPAY